ncbi:MAG: EscU/YscU/HrcU family type III secretion system export apparatus switch protein [Pseudomonadota bacterium]
MNSDQRPGLNPGDKTACATSPSPVALQESGEEGKAPSVVATGEGEVAQAILDVAFALGIKVREDADLAEMLSVVDLGDEVPTQAFHAIAEILSYLYRAQGKLEPTESFKWT